MTTGIPTKETIKKFEHVYARLADLSSSLRTQGNYQVASYVERAIRALDAALAAPEANAKPFGTYVERNDGSTEFRLTGEAHSPTAQGYKCWMLYAGNPPASVADPIPASPPNPSCDPYTGWRPHDGTSDPDAPGDTLVEVCFRDGDTAFGLAHDWDQSWQWADTSDGLKSAGAIIAWRPHGPARAAASELCPHCDGTGDVSEKGRIEECLACDGTGKPGSKPARWEVQRPSDGEWVLVSQNEAARFESLGRIVRALYPETAAQMAARSAAK